MKKLLLATSLLLVTACTSEEEPATQAEETEEHAEQQEEQKGNQELNFTISDEGILERDEFIETYNSYKETENIEDIQEPREESIAIWQKLYEGDADIEIKYSEDGNVIGYNVSVDPELENSLGYASIVAESIGLNIDTFLSHVEKSVDGEEADYEENGYDVTFTNMLELGMFTINFDK